MQLNDVDDLPFHQHPTPFNMLATSDPHFNDGYFFAFYAADWYVLAGLRLHPNTNTIDGFAGLTHDGEQRCVRASRTLRPRYSELAAGPIRLDVEQLMERHRLVLEENDAGFAFDVTFAVQAPPFVEERYQTVKHGRIIGDTLRYTQVCRATGTVRCDGRDLEVDGWHAMRDHSWGIRASMGPPTRFGGIEEPGVQRDRRALRLWMPFQVGDHCGFFNTHEDRDGETLDFEGRLDFDDGRSVGLRSIAHDLQVGPAGPVGTVDLVDEEGVTRRYELAVAGAPADVQGLGYYGGWADHGSAGVYRGPETIEVDRYPTGTEGERSGPAHVPVRRRIGPTEFPRFVTGPGGTTGMAHFEYSILAGAKPPAPPS
ncbi:hypothetical protein FSW04_14905 [Baekduia soli]|uniref:Uncharacterized protein n=1 Tax=Baekduia soli TaxID=496014 RepID=A0A5B8U7S3_9ACTN|nr:hypothetical protein [Baekduia soli]QEC48732.1 hypothetical protein FSW04_14905 [Baekduia soli]